LFDRSEASPRLIKVRTVAGRTPMASLISLSGKS
jgi:hypothetical protein